MFLLCTGALCLFCHHTMSFSKTLFFPAYIFLTCNMKSFNRLNNIINDVCTYPEKISTLAAFQTVTSSKKNYSSLFFHCCWCFFLHLFKKFFLLFHITKFNMCACIRNKHKIKYESKVRKERKKNFQNATFTLFMNEFYDRNFVFCCILVICLHVI